MLGPFHWYSVIEIGIAAAVVGIVVLIGWLQGIAPQIAAREPPDLEQRAHLHVAQSDVAAEHIDELRQRVDPGVVKE